MKVLAVTLARGGSKAIPRKNITLINNIPLIAYTIREVNNSELISDYIVSTDDPTIANVAKEYGAQCPFLRSPDLATDTSSSSSALIDAVERYEALTTSSFDIIVEVMCTNPLKTTFDIDSCISSLISNPHADTCIAVHQLDDHHPARIKKIVNGQLHDFCVPEPLEARRQDLKPNAYIRSGSIYAMRKDFLLKNQARYGGNDIPYILPIDRALNIDGPRDLQLAQLILSGSQ